MPPTSLAKDKDDKKHEIYYGWTLVLQVDPDVSQNDSCHKVYVT